MPCLSFKLEATLLFILLVSPYVPFVTALSSNATLDIITPAQPLPKGGALVSPNGEFRLLFFSPGNRSTAYYIGVWFWGEVVWVANREKPLPATAVGVLKISVIPGSSVALVLADNNTGSVYWSSADSTPNATRSRLTVTGIKTVAARLEDSGNLVLLDGPSSVVWQSFDYPTATLLPGMKIGWNSRTGMKWSLHSSSSQEDPSSGRYTFSLDPSGIPQLFVRGPGGIPKSYLGYWNGKGFSAVPETQYIDDFLTFEYFADAELVYFSFRLANPSTRSRLVLDHLGVLHQYILPEGKAWASYWTRPQYKCDYYRSCGPNSMCDRRYNCSCLKGYGPVGTSKVCARQTALNCSKSGAFEKMPLMKLPDMTNATVDMKMVPSRCQETCEGNCSCLAYAIANITSNSGCVMWNGELFELTQFAVLQTGQDLFVRTLVVDSHRAIAKRSKRKIALIVIVVTCFMFVASVPLILISTRKRMASRRTEKGRKTIQEEINEWGGEVTSFDLCTIARATNNFAFSNKIGQGGFGVVYKGLMDDGQQIAVKRLSVTSPQGFNEFMNEVKLIVKLQHRNLVRLLGCCIDENERILVYEYMQNKSLDKFIFGKCENVSLDWPQRVNIIHGIARGLLYLHEDSRLKIIHRDLKVANVLLDGLMNPKISDFGTARIFECEQKEENTRRVIGTIGYLSPEYAIEGKFSTKSDVFSFGVILLEIISGLENMNNKSITCAYDEDKNLLALAWRLWQEGESMKLLDPKLLSKCRNLEVVRYIQIGLLCVQESPIKRPNMSSVVPMLSSDIDLPDPTRPGIFRGRTSTLAGGHSSPSNKQESCGLLTITDVEGR